MTRFGTIKEFKITMVNMLKALVGKVDNIWIHAEFQQRETVKDTNENARN